MQIYSEIKLMMTACMNNNIGDCKHNSKQTDILQITENLDLSKFNLDVTYGIQMRIIQDNEE